MTTVTTPDGGNIELKKNQKWYVKIRDASCVVKRVIIDVTPMTVLLKESGSFNSELRYMISDLTWVELISSR